MLTLLQAAGLPECGGKAATLGRLAAAGVPIPAGIVLTGDEAASIAAGRSDGLCGELARWGRLHAPYGLIVRSSAAGEDSDDASFAGLFTSCFTPPASGGVAQAVTQVHGCAGSEAVRGYAAALGIEPPTHMAVLVQTAIRPACSGVMFTAWSGGWRIEATLGLANLLVAGECVPDVIETGPAGQVSRHIAEKYAAALPATTGELDTLPGEWAGWPGGGRAKLVFSRGGLIYTRPPRHLINEPAVNAATEAALLALARDAQDSLGTQALDIEWACDGTGKLWLVQARPATHTGPTHSTSQTPPSAAPAAGRVLMGQAASPGTATGPATIILDPAHAEQMPGNAILVSGAARPELVPALLKAAGIACSDAGLLCHTAIVARELGKPCVTGLLTAPETVRDRQHVTVDGDTGTLTVHDGPVTTPATVPPDATPPDQPRRQPAGMRVIARLPEAGCSPQEGGPLALALDHETASLLDDPAALVQAGIVAVLLPAGADIPAGLGSAGRDELPGAAALVWLTPPPAGTPGFPPLWAGLPGEQVTAVLLADKETSA
jgi:pyruvate,water dikinase